MESDAGDDVLATGGGGGVTPIERVPYVSAPARNPYLGGFRDVRTGIEYHHAYTQTEDLRPPKPPRAVQFTRDTQTTSVVTRSCQTFREGVAQTRRPGFYEDTSRDVVLVPRPYFSAAELLLVRESKALVLQCHWRSYVARKTAAERRAKLDAERSLAQAAADTQRAAEERKIARDAERRLNPRSLDDFSILYDEVEAWRLAETDRIKREFAEDVKGQKAALAALLAKETALISTIERLRSAAGSANRDAQVVALLSSLAAPKVWELSGGADPATVHTPLTTRAAELKALFDELSSPSDDRDARTEVLLSVKYTVREFDCPLTREIVLLVDREVDLLGRGRPAATLDGLRKRLRTLFLTFCTTPEFNPAAGTVKQHPLVATAVAVAAAASSAPAERGARRRATSAAARGALAAGSDSRRGQATSNGGGTAGLASAGGPPSTSNGGGFSPPPTAFTTSSSMA
jgi:hypothetical protein